METSNLLSMSKAELEILFESSLAGPFPNGGANGTAIIAPGTIFTAEIAELINIFAWQGKIFDAKNHTLVNRITAFGLNAILARVDKESSWVDGKECIVLDYSQTSVAAHWIRDEIRFIGNGLYLGTVF
jgi:hypothetical protein